MTSFPASGAVAQLASFLQQHPWWSAFWDKEYGVWRVAEDDPESRTVSVETLWRYNAITCALADLPVCGRLDRDNLRVSAMAPPLVHRAGTR